MSPLEATKDYKPLELEKYKVDQSCTRNGKIAIKKILSFKRYATSLNFNSEYGWQLQRWKNTMKKAMKRHHTG